jgi:hypothetical protein
MMNHRRVFSLLSLAGALMFIFASSASAQITGSARVGEVFENKEEGYALKLPPNWQAIVSEDGLGRRQVDIVYKGVREEGHLKIRRVQVESGTKAMETAKREEEQTLRFKPGYAKGPVEDFAAGYPAALITYDYTQAGRPKMGRAYFLLINETTVFSLRFEGNRPTMGPLRSQTDLIVRSFKMK